MRRGAARVILEILSLFDRGERRTTYRANPSTSARDEDGLAE